MVPLTPPPHPPTYSTVIYHFDIIHNPERRVVLHDIFSEGEDDGFTREEKEARMYDRSRRYGQVADRVYDAFVHEYDLPGEDMQEQRDLFLEVIQIMTNINN